MDDFVVRAYHASHGRKAPGCHATQSIPVYLRIIFGGLDLAYSSGTWGIVGRGSGYPSVTHISRATAGARHREPVDRRSASVAAGTSTMPSSRRTLPMPRPPGPRRRKSSPALFTRIVCTTP